MSFYFINAKLCHLHCVAKTKLQKERYIFFNIRLRRLDQLYLSLYFNRLRSSKIIWREQVVSTKEKIDCGSKSGYLEMNKRKSENTSPIANKIMK